MIVFDSAKMKRKQPHYLHSWLRKTVKVRPFMSINVSMQTSQYIPSQSNLELMRGQVIMILEVKVSWH